MIMKKNSRTALLTSLFLLSLLVVCGQTEEVKLGDGIRAFHQELVNKNTVTINQLTDKALTYGHSNGWVETKADMLKNLESGYMKYSSFREDSMQVVINANVAHARFVADIEAGINGNMGKHHLKVLEVWVKKGRRWVLFARQAVKA